MRVSLWLYLSMRVSLCLYISMLVSLWLYLSMRVSLCLYLSMRVKEEYTSLPNRVFNIGLNSNSAKLTTRSENLTKKFLLKL